MDLKSPDIALIACLGILLAYNPLYIDKLRRRRIHESWRSIAGCWWDLEVSAASENKNSWVKNI